MILVTGGEGFIGSHLVYSIEGAVPLDDRSFSKHKFNNTIVMDIRSTDIYDVVKKSDYVIHCACRDIRNSIEYPIIDAEVNVIGTLNLLRACREFKKGILYISSVSVHHEASHYAVSKRTGERYCLMYRQWIPTTIVRLSNVFGLRDTESVIGKWLRNDEITLIDPNHTRDFTYYKDTIAGILAAYQKNPQEIIDIGTGVQTKLSEIAEWISSKMNKKIIRISSREIDNVKNRVVDTKKMNEILGFQARYELFESLEYMIKNKEY